MYQTNTQLFYLFGPPTINLMLSCFLILIWPMRNAHQQKIGTDGTAPQTKLTMLLCLVYVNQCCTQSPLLSAITTGRCQKS